MRPLPQRRAKVKCRIEFPPGTKFLKINRSGDGLMSVEIEPEFFRSDSKVTIAYLTAEKSDGMVTGRAAISISGITGGLVNRLFRKPVRPQCETRPEEALV
jgi:hypothetical protein